MANMRTRQTFELAVPVAGPSNSGLHARQSAKRVASDGARASLRKQEPLSKRLRSSIPSSEQGSQRPAEASSSRSSSSVPVVVTFSPGSRATPTRVGTVNRSSYTASRITQTAPPVTTMSADMDLSNSSNSDDEEDGFVLRSAPMPQRPGGKSTIPTTSKGKQREVTTRSAAPPLHLPGVRKMSSNKRNKINDLLSASRPREFDNEVDHEVTPRIIIETSPTKAPRSKSKIASLPSIEAKDSARMNESDMDIDTAVSISAAEASTSERSLTGEGPGPHHLPSPAPSLVPHSGQTDNPLLTPTKKHRGRSKKSEVAAIGISPNSKLSPTKAVKPLQSDVPELSTTLLIPQSRTPPALPTPSSTPDRVLAKMPHFDKNDVINMLDAVLYRLSGPSATLFFDNVESPSSESYHSWLAERPCLSPAHQTAEADVRATLNRTVWEGEGNCMLLVGERGIGKTAIVNRGLRTLEAAHGVDSFQVVRLSGLVQRDDKSALKEIARQLCSSAYIEDAEGEEGGPSFSSNASILASLLAILEPGHGEDQEEAANKSKPLIFIIDEFDLFAHHSIRQSFLYCLLDCVQSGSRRGGMAVIGLSARADCIETLEKRVKSRCQSRVHHILPAEDLFKGGVDTAKAAVMLSEVTDLNLSWNAGVEAFFADKIVQMHLTAMNELRGLDADRKVLDLLVHLISQLRQRIESSSPMLRPAGFALQATSIASFLQASERPIPATLSIAEVAMIIAAKHIVEEERPLNFVVAYERYAEHSKRAAAGGTVVTRPYSRAVCLRAFERLRSIGLIRDAASGSKVSRVTVSIFKLARLVPWPFMVEDAVKARKDIPEHLRKWCKAWSD